MNLKILIFHVYFLNMDISLIIALIALKTCMYISGICMEGSVSQNFELGLSFCLMVCRRRNFEKKYKNSQKLPVFYHKIKTRTYTKNLRHTSLDKNVFFIYSKFYTCRFNIK